MADPPTRPSHERRVLRAVRTTAVQVDVTLVRATGQQVLSHRIDAELSRALGAAGVGPLQLQDVFLLCLECPRVADRTVDDLDGLGDGRVPRGCAAVAVQGPIGDLVLIPRADFLQGGYFDGGLGIGEDHARGDVEESVNVFDFHGFGGSSWRIVSAAGVR